MIGQRIGNYRIVRQLGAGGMGSVYEAVHDQLRRRAAIKVLRTEYARNQELVARFLNEARAVNVIGHPSLVSIYELGQLPDGNAFIIMEYLEGDRLSDRLRRTGGAGPWALRMARQIAAALQAAHDKGIVHRDLKPDNIMIVPDPEVPGGERVKVLDFGIAKMKIPEDDSQLTEVHTRTGMVMGTPRYMSPEQCRGAGGVDARADVYALGVILYEAVAGRTPFVLRPGEGPGDLLARHLNEQPPPLTEQAEGIPEEVAALVHAMLAKRPGERPSMRQVVVVLDGLLSRVVEPRTVVGEAGAAAVAAPEEPDQHPSTLRQGTGQTRPLIGRRSSQVLVASLGVGLLVAVVGVLGALQEKERPRSRAHEGPSRPVSTPAAPVPVPPPPPRLVQWSLDSMPPGATVIRKSDGKDLGQTPWQREQPAGSGRLGLVLRLPGFKDRDLELDLGTDATRVERLLHRGLSAPSPPQPSRRQQKPEWEKDPSGAPIPALPGRPRP